MAGFNLAAPLRAATALTARTVAEVQEAVRAVARSGGRLAPIATGHSTSMLAPVAAGLAVVRTALDEPVTVDPDRGTVRIPAGARWDDVVTAAAVHGYAVPHGLSPTVGAVGYLLGGGLSFYGRAFGVAANHLLSITIVRSDGEIVTVDHDHDAELFWALRGGGFGVVVAVELRMFAMLQVVTGSTTWDASDPAVTAGIARAWLDWTRTAPWSATTTLRLMHMPDLPAIPELLRARRVLMVDGAVTVGATADDTDHQGAVPAALRTHAELMDPLTALKDPLLDTWHLGPVTDVVRTHGDPEQPMPYTGDSFGLGGVDGAAMDLWVAAAGPDSGSRIAIAELRQLGGAFAEAPADGGAFAAIDADLLAHNASFVMGPQDAMHAREDFEDVRGALGDYLTDRTAPTFVEDPSTPRRTFAPEIEDRVEAIRRRVDPEGLFTLDARRSSDL